VESHRFDEFARLFLIGGKGYVHHPSVDVLLRGVTLRGLRVLLHRVQVTEEELN
jgi:hypothetical protein